MSDLFHKGGSVAQAQFRDTTTKRNMLGSTFIPQKASCCRCGKSKTEKTGSYRGDRFVCHQCGRDGATHG